MGNSIDTDEVARRLRMARAYAGISVSEAAQVLRVSRHTISNWESGRLPTDARRLGDIIRRYKDLTEAVEALAPVEEMAA